MEFDTYKIRAMRTAKPMDFDDDLMHSALGLAGESGEFADAVKKYLVYGKPLDRENAIEELGDSLWFIALACNALGVPMSQVAQANLDKLARRYPEKYSDKLATDRLDKK